MQKNKLRIIINILSVMSWLTCLGTIISSFLVKDTLSPYELSVYMQTIGIINLICLFFIFIKGNSDKFLK